VLGCCCFDWVEDVPVGVAPCTCVQGAPYVREAYVHLQGAAITSGVVAAHLVASGAVDAMSQASPGVSRVGGAAHSVAVLEAGPSVCAGYVAAVRRAVW